MAFGFGPFGGAAFASLDLSYATATVTGVPSSGVVHTIVGSADGNATLIVFGSEGLSNPSFYLGTSTFTTYDNNGSGKVTRTFVTDLTAPNTSKTVQQIDVASGTTPFVTTSPGFGGFYRANTADSGIPDLDTYHRGQTYIWTIRAKIPVGYDINWASNAFGTEGTLNALTSLIGTGNWFDYQWKQVIGTTGTFSSSGHFYINGTGTGPFTWYVAVCSFARISTMFALGGVTGDGNISLTGVSGTGLLHSVTITVDQTRIVTGVTSTGTLNNVTLSAGATRTVTGVTSVGIVNTVTPLGITNITVTGVISTGTINSVTISAGTTRVITNVTSAGTLNGVSINAGQTVIVAGVVGSGTLNSVTISISVTPIVAGVVGSGTLNSVTPLGITKIVVTNVIGSGIVNSPTINADQTRIVTGASSASGVNSVIGLGVSVATVTQVIATGFVGTITGTGTALIIITNVLGFGTVNSVASSASSTITVTNISATSVVHTPLTFVGAYTLLGNVLSAGSVGTLVVRGDGNTTVSGIACVGSVHSVNAINYVNGIAYTSNITTIGISGVLTTYIIDPVDADGAGGVPVFSGIPLALVGDYVGTGTVSLLSDPINATITYRNIPLALETAIILSHVGPTHPTIALGSTLPTGSPDAIVSNAYRLIRLGDIASCGDPVTLNPSLVNPTIRVAELHERGRTAIP